MTLFLVFFLCLIFVAVVAWWARGIWNYAEGYAAGCFTYVAETVAQGLAQPSATECCQPLKETPRRDAKALSGSSHPVEPETLSKYDAWCEQVQAMQRPVAATGEDAQ